MQKITLTTELRDELLIFSDLITQQNRMYTAEDIHKIYSLHNRIYSSSKKPNGCASCLRSTLRELAKVIKSL